MYKVYRYIILYCNLHPYLWRPGFLLNTCGVSLDFSSTLQPSGGSNHILTFTSSGNDPIWIHYMILFRQVETTNNRQIWRVGRKVFPLLTLKTRTWIQLTLEFPSHRFHFWGCFSIQHVLGGSIHTEPYLQDHPSTCKGLTTRIRKFSKYGCYPSKWPFMVSK